MRKTDLWTYGAWRFLSETPPSNVPVVFWKRIGTLRRRGGAALAGVTVFWLVVLCILLLSPRRILYAPLAFKIGSALGSYAVMRTVRLKYYRARTEFCRWVSHQDYRVCTVCAYSQNGLPDEHDCPECGRHFEVGGLEDEWKRIFRKFYEGEGVRKKRQRGTACVSSTSKIDQAEDSARG